jgi:alpha-beta hydrolase superfamily lysophospholipase
MRTMTRSFLTLAIGLFATMWTYAALPQHGPDPTVSSLEASQGPYAIASTKVLSPDGYGAATVYYPTSRTDGPYGLVVLAPGFLLAQGYYAWLAERVASHGFVVANLNTNGIFDSPDMRAPQLASALKQVLALSQAAASPYSGLVNPERLALMGHSAGGGAALTAALGNPGLKTVVGLTLATGLQKEFSPLKVPTLVLAAEKDLIAPNTTYSRPVFKSLDAALPSAYIEIAGADHLTPTNLEGSRLRAVLGRYTIAWLKRFVDSDRRYTPFTRGSSEELSRYESHGAW